MRLFPKLNWRKDGVMTSNAAYDRYVHTIRAAYVSLGLAQAVDNNSLSIPSYQDVAACSREQMLTLGVSAIRRRLALFDPSLNSQILQQPFLHRMSFHNRYVDIPILNEEGREWYAKSPVFNFDFMAEDFIGMHNGAQTIYDIGGHQGVWALYYATANHNPGRVYSFEPSIINVECSALSFLINDICNVINIPAGIGATNARIGPTHEGLLVGGVSHQVNLIRLDQIFWEPADFVKIDIEGFEYDLLTSFPIFEFCHNVHLELHIPFLENRGLDYRDVFNLIPFDKVRVRRWHALNLIDIGPEDVLESYCTLLITPKDHTAG